MNSKSFLLRPFASETKYYSIQSTKGRTANWRFCGEKKSLPQNLIPTEMFCWSQK